MELVEEASVSKDKRKSCFWWHQNDFRGQIKNKYEGSILSLSAGKGFVTEHWLIPEEQEDAGLSLFI